MTGPLGCTVLVDGARVADSADDDPLSPVALAGLTVTWGRSTTLDQPEPASCTVQVRDKAGGDGFLGLLATGKRLDVRTDTTIYPDPTVPTITDPGFATTGPGRILDNATLTVGGGVATLTPGPTTTRRARVIFAPAAFVPQGTNPAAWDLIPKTAPGQTWRFGATLRLPAPFGQVMTGTVRPVTFTAPWSSTAKVLETVTVTAPGDGAPHPVAKDFIPPPGVWLGLAIDTYPPGPTWDQIPPTLTWDAIDPTLTWDGIAQAVIDDLLMLAPAAGTTRAALVFSGRITDLSAERAGDASLVNVIAQDHTSEMANRDIGDVPWPAEPLGVRAQRIVTLSGQPTAITVDAAPAVVTVTRRDVDTQQALPMLQDLATTADGVLWSAVHMVTGQYLRLEDTHARPPMLIITKQGDGVIRIVPDPNPAAANHISACDILLEPVRWVQDVADVSTRVAVSWQEQTAPPADVVEHTETVSDPDLITRLGVRRISVSTQLTTSTAAGQLAGGILARTSDLGWRIQGLTWSTGVAPLDEDDVARAFLLLDGTTRLGAPLLLTDLPDWSPAAANGVLPLFLEGGRYTFEGGDWVLDLTVSSARAQGRGPTWDQLPADWTWDQFDPSITWDQLAGVRPV